MRLSIKDNQRINAIIASLTNDDLDNIRTEVEELVSRKRQNPLFSAIANYEPTEFTHVANEWLSLSDIDYQVMISEALWDALLLRTTREYAITIYLDETRVGEPE